jgi:FKBP-type peptidyl-prolyl cis-trans isomerase SlyD
MLRSPAQLSDGDDRPVTPLTLCARLRAVAIEAHKVVSIEYVLTDAGGKVLDSSHGRDPLAYLHGAGNIVPGLEKALEGKAEGDTLEVSVPPEEGYGVRDERLIQNVAIRKLPNKKAEVGMQLRAQTEHGMRVLTVTAVRGDYATVDANHPLAGRTLNFKVTVKAIRDATEEELAHGHVHGPHGHDH